MRLQVRLQRLVGLLALLLASWTWIVLMARDMYGPMTGAAAWMMTMRWDASHIVLLWAMWAVMMTAMMLPAALPLVLLYANSTPIGDRRGSAPRVYALVGGYLTVWALFSVGAVVLQRLLSRLVVLTPMMEPATPIFGAVVLAVAGVYQLTPLKKVCLQACRSPLSFVMHRQRAGGGSAFRMGLDHGAYCLGCCWALMLLLFAGGVMNLAVIVTLTAWVLVEKVMPFGEQSARIAGALLIVTAGVMLMGGP